MFAHVGKPHWLRRFVPGLLAVGMAASAAWAASAKAYTVIASHPRIWLTADLLATLQARAAGGDKNWLKTKAKADGYLGQIVDPFDRVNCADNHICYSYQGGGWWDAWFSLSLAYKITGNAAYARQAMAVAQSAIDADKAGNLLPIQADSGYPSRFAPLGLAIVFDWCYEQLSPPQRQEIIATLKSWYTWAIANGGAYQVDGPANSNYFGGHVLGFGAASYATFGDNPDAQSWIDAIRAKYDAVITAAWSAQPWGGYPAESYNYGPNHFVRLLEYQLLVKTAQGEDLIAGAGYARKMARNLLYNLKPNRWQSSDEGDFPGDFTGIMPASLPVMLTYALPGAPEGQWMQWFYDHMATPPDGASIQRWDETDLFLFSTPGGPSADYRAAAPPVFKSDGDGHIYARSDWSDNAVWGSFNSSAGPVIADHQDRNAGHLAIQRGADNLLVNASHWKGTNGYSGSPQSDDKISFLANTLFFDDGGAYNYAGDQYKGGQGYWGANALLAYDVNQEHVYAKADLTSAYDISTGAQNPKNRSLQLFVRSWVYLGNGLFAVFDRVQAQSGAFTKRLYWHLNPTNPTVIKGNTARTAVGSSALFTSTLLPAQLALSLTSDPPSYNAAGQTSTRLVVADAGPPGASLTALTIFDATDASVAAMPAAGLISAGNMLGSLIEDPGNFRVVLFSADGRPQTRAGYTAAHSGSARHLIVDLDPGKSYAVSQNGQVIASAIAPSSQGVLAFPETGGGAFTVSAGGQPLSPCDLNRDGAVDGGDVAIARDRALGKQPCTPDGDLNSDGKCDILDVQRVIAAALGSLCRVGP